MKSMAIVRFHPSLSHAREKTKPIPESDHRRMVINGFGSIASRSNSREYDCQISRPKKRNPDALRRTTKTLEKLKLGLCHKEEGRDDNRHQTLCQQNIGKCGSSCPFMALTILADENKLTNQ